MELFQWFFIELSVLPTRCFEISAHLFPKSLCDKNRIHSYFSLHWSFLILGFKWLCHLSRHCFPILPSRCSEIKVHFWAPYFAISSISRISYSGVQDFFLLFILTVSSCSCSDESASSRVDPWGSCLVFGAYFKSGASSSMAVSMILFENRRLGWELD